jgi:hypothetical protein
MQLKQIFLKILLSFFSIIITLVLVEIFLRFTPYNSHFMNPLKSTLYRGFFVSDDKTGIDLPENMPKKSFWGFDGEFVSWTNEIGIFDKPYNGEKEYILLVGDSFTWGYTPFERKFGTIIEKKLGIRVLKAGVSGYGTKTEMIKAEKVIKKVNGVTPKLIIVGYYSGNDFLDDYYFPRYSVVDGYMVSTYKRVDKNNYKIEKRSLEEIREIIKNMEVYNMENKPRYPKFQKVKVWLKKHSILYNIMRNRGLFRNTGEQIGIVEKPQYVEVSSYTPMDKFPWLKKIWTNHLQNIKQFKEISEKKYNSKFLVVLIPDIKQVYDFLKTDSNYDYNNPNKILKTFFQKNKIAYLDLTSIIRDYADQNKKSRIKFNPDRDFYWVEDSHLSPYGNEFIGKIISKYIIENNLIKVKDGKLKLNELNIEISNSKLVSQY